MSLSVRLPYRVEEALGEYCVRHRMSKSEVVQEALAAYLEEEAPGDSAHARLRALGLLDDDAPSLLEGAAATKEGIRAAARRRLAGGQGG